VQACAWGPAGASGRGLGGWVWWGARGVGAGGQGGLRGPRRWFAQAWRACCLGQ
jgi:hypothetical protein